MFEYESTNWATGPQAQGTDEFDDCFCAGSRLIVSNDGKHEEKERESICKKQDMELL